MEVKERREDASPRIITVPGNATVIFEMVHGQEGYAVDEMYS